jgi:phage baseplate assembly protein V
MLTRDLLAQLEHLARPLRNQLVNIMARAVLQLVDDTKKMQVVQVGVPETRPDAEHFQPYGFFSVPLPGAEGVALFPGGDRGHPLVIVISDRRYRPTGSEPGTAGIHNQTGARVVVLADGSIEARSSGGSAAPVATKADLTALKSAINGWTPVAGDGGAALKAALLALFAGPPAWPAGTSVLKAE